MTAAQVLAAMQAGARLHLHYEEGEAVWWLSRPWRRVPSTISAVVRRDPRVRPQGDTLLADTAPQTWLLSVE